MSQDISTYSAHRSCHLARWRRNRDHTNGIDAVKDAGTLYLHRKVSSTFMADTNPNNVWGDYIALKNETEYFPAAARTLQSFIGLVFRKSPALRAPDTLAAMADVISCDGQSLEAVARWAFREYSITNCGGLLVDHVDTPDGMSKAMAAALDVRPYLAPYCAENILELTHGVIGGRKTLMRVRLREGSDTVRDLQLIDGAYTVLKWTLVDGTWHLESQTTPLQNGTPIPYIPFVSFADGEEGASMDDICATNNVHYLQSANLATALKWITAPVTVTTGVAEDVELSVEAGAHWRLESVDAKVFWHEYTGQGVPALERKLDKLESHMAMLGSRMLASEKAAAEAAETVARRQSSENSILASMARHISEKLTQGLKLAAQRLGIDPVEVSYILSTDFIPMPIDPQLLAQVMALHNSGKLPLEALFEILQNGELLNENWDFETYAASLDTNGAASPFA
ncbi:DUF4055 domain-containing protein [Sphingomonas sp. AR_OL41]|uniref:DUF4055 domain-containing protein n=1 Tax=Sphingomonas sp. AR_OL41 TaxID=3042729 RepID=UPI00247FE349|nr:DUF4055 domain-containing protein [Sphingomonas sp. AR_OL41]MDH7971048.1 DUF4055 domain-containing protein [Sphingomonas sp. AR_OL41]